MAISIAMESICSLKGNLIDIEFVIDIAIEKLLNTAYLKHS